MRRFCEMLVLFALFISILSSCHNNTGDTLDVGQNENGNFVQQSGAYPRLIAHGGGAVYGYRLTNSLEAIEQSYANGFRYMEIDFERTSDGRYVLLHDWEPMAKRLLFEERVLTHKEFIEAETFSELTLLDADMLLDWLSKHDDCYIITDGKCDNLPFLEALYTMAGEQADRFIPQAYSFEEFRQIRELGFENVILTLYWFDTVDVLLLKDFVSNSDPWAVTVSGDRLTSELLEVLAPSDVPVYAHTVNDLSFFEQWEEQGLYGIYTDYFCPAKWPYR